MALQKQHQLFITGLGIKSISHLTEEARQVISECDCILYLLNEPLLKEYITTKARLSVDLESIYFDHAERHQAYQQITAMILSQLDQHQRLGVVCYGHPFFCAAPFLDAAVEARSKGHQVHSMPGISSLDCLFSDLLIDPTTDGLQVLEATSLLSAQKKIDTTSHVVILQVGFIHVSQHTHECPDNPGFDQLIKCLNDNYPSHHAITRYEASLYPSVEPVIQTKALSQVAEFEFSALTTFYLSPIQGGD